ncbi:MAG: patatin-like phospholipase family protein, partial [Planctomycetes bacterium]|nr:patatin-like phospholipase family protein [Planctomycetota bacterium]
GIASSLPDYQVGDDRFGYLAPNRPNWKDTEMLAATPTRLAAMEPWRQQALINWGYVVCDAALRKYAQGSLESLCGHPLQPARGLPYANPV